MNPTMKLVSVKRLVVSALLALAVAGVAATALPADDAAAGRMRNCYPNNYTSDNQCAPQ